MQALAAERRTTPLELLWDLVFVFAVTQVTRLLSLHLSWAGLGQSMLVLALIWWAWSAFVWAANAQSADSPSLRFSLLLGAVFILMTGLAVPEAFLGESTLFAVTYAVVRSLHLALYADASRRGSAAWSAIAGFALTWWSGWRG
jgi:low temperature requirement protein LtrA